MPVLRYPVKPSFCKNSNGNEKDAQPVQREVDKYRMSMKDKMSKKRNTLDPKEREAIISGMSTRMANLHMEIDSFKMTNFPKIVTDDKDTLCDLHTNTLSLNKRLREIHASLKFLMDQMNLLH